MTTEKYERYESPTGEVTIADTDTEVFTFSGEPDSIVLQASTNPLFFTLTDLLGRERHVIKVPTGQTIETHVSRRRVLARNVNAGAGGFAFVTGKWAERGERA